MKKGLLWFGLPLLLLVVLLFTPAFPSWAGIPYHIRLFPGSEFSLYLQTPFRLADENGDDVTGTGREFSLIPNDIGRQEFQVRLFGLIPLRELVVDVVPEVKVVPGGHSIGVLINPTGLTVSRVTPVRGVDGRDHFPAAEGGVQPGDILLSVGGQQVRRPEQVGTIVNKLAPTENRIPLEIKRNDQVLRRSVTPILSYQEDVTGRRHQVYLLGLFLEDPAAGVGTLTFYDPESRRYAALGHTIADGMGRSIEISQGSIVQASIDSVKLGLRGFPGEKLGSFQDERDVLGTVDHNSSFGIFGYLANFPPNPYFSQSIPIGLAHQVQTGPAYLYTVIDGNRIRRFDVEITKVVSQNQPDDKGIVLRVVDPRLLQETGGIVQGMSGSPIVQNGRLIGAVTHVFINNPVMGYGNFVEWMVYEAGLQTLDSESVAPLLDTAV